MIKTLLAAVGDFFVKLIMQWFDRPKTSVENIPNAIDEALPTPSVDSLVDKYSRVL